MTSFSAQIAAEVAQIKNGLEMVVRQSAQDLADEIDRPVAQGGNMPVLDGYLRNSRVMVLNGPPPAMTTKPKGFHNTSAPPAVEFVLAGFKIGDTIGLYYTAAHGPAQEYGARGRPGRAFVRQAATKWASFVSANAARLLNGR